MRTLYIDGIHHLVLSERHAPHNHVRLIVARHDDPERVPYAEHTIPTAWWNKPPSGAITTGGSTYELPASRDDGSGRF